LARSRVKSERIPPSNAIARIDPIANAVLYCPKFIAPIFRAINRLKANEMMPTINEENS